MEKKSPGANLFITDGMLSGVKGFNLCAFFVALEGWRRGLTLKWYYDPSRVTDIKQIGFDPIGKTFSLSLDDKTHFFFRSRGDKVANEAVDFGTDKREAKHFFEKANVPTPQGRGFKQEDRDELILDYAFTLGFPLVVKPTFGSLGKGVFTKIQDETTLKETVSYVRNDMDYPDIIVEKHYDGDDFRVYVIEDEVVGAIKRIPANVTGDGESSIEQLINKKNEERKNNPHFLTRLITIDKDLIDYIRLKEYTLESIPGKNEQVFLKGKSNISAGGDSIDVTNELPSEVKKVAIEAVQALPGLNHGGVDLIYDGTETVVIEINPTAGISLHQFPFEGNPQNVAGRIVDYYFPETKDNKRSNMYFDFKEILRLLRSKFVYELEVPPAVREEIYAKKYIVTGKVQGVGFRYWIRKQALLNNLNGYTRNLKNGKVVVVVGSANKEDVDQFKATCLQGPDGAVVERVTESIWETPIKVGFEIRKTQS